MALTDLEKTFVLGEDCLDCYLSSRAHNSQADHSDLSWLFDPNKLGESIDFVIGPSLEDGTTSAQPVGTHTTALAQDTPDDGQATIYRQDQTRYILRTNARSAHANSETKDTVNTFQHYPTPSCRSHRCTTRTCGDARESLRAWYRRKLLSYLI